MAGPSIKRHGVSTPLPDPATGGDAAPISGRVDGLSRDRAHGWVRDGAFPDAAVTILVTAAGRLLGRTVANRFRADLLAAGIGDGRFAFEVRFDPPLSPSRSWLVHVRSEATGQELPGSPLRLPVSREFDEPARRTFSALLNGFATEAELDERIAFLTTERETLLRRRADRMRLRPEAGMEPVPAGRRALVIDHQLPRPDHDGGSVAITSHMRALQRLGFAVSFAGAAMTDGSRDAAAALERDGIACCRLPAFATVEEVLRREAGGFDMVYLHRVSVCAAYAALVRQTQPRARLVFVIADLHHLRLQRQAAFEDRPELAREAERLRGLEIWCAGVADAVVTHSTVEAEMLRAVVDPARVHVAAWSVPVAARRRSFAERSGLALLGHYGHGPNVAAAFALRDEILPAVRAADPSIEAVLVGDALPEALRAPVPGLRHAGHVARLDDVFDAVRLTVAPLPFGAGVKAKVLASLAAGVPCACSPVAAEGLGLPPRLHELVAADTAAMAELVLRLHRDEPFNARMSRRGLAFAARAFSEAALDRALRPAVLPKLVDDRETAGL